MMDGVMQNYMLIKRISQNDPTLESNCGVAPRQAGESSLFNLRKKDQKKGSVGSLTYKDYKLVETKDGRKTYVSPDEEKMLLLDAERESGSGKDEVSYENEVGRLEPPLKKSAVSSSGSSYETPIQSERTKSNNLTEVDGKIPPLHRTVDDLQKRSTEPDATEKRHTYPFDVFSDDGEQLKVPPHMQTLDPVGRERQESVPNLPQKPKTSMISDWLAGHKKPEAEKTKVEKTSSNEASDEGKKKRKSKLKEMLTRTKSATSSDTSDSEDDKSERPRKHSAMKAISNIFGKKETPGKIHGQSQNEDEQKTQDESNKNEQKADEQFPEDRKDWDDAPAEFQRREDKKQFSDRFKNIFAHRPKLDENVKHAVADDLGKVTSDSSEDEGKEKKQKRKWWNPKARNETDASKDDGSSSDSDSGGEEKPKKARNLFGVVGERKSKEAEKSAEELTEAEGKTTDGEVDKDEKQKKPITWFGVVGSRRSKEAEKSEPDSEVDKNETDSEEKQKKPKKNWFGSLRAKKEEGDKPKEESATAEADSSGDEVEKDRKDKKSKTNWFGSLNLKKDEGEKSKRESAKDETDLSEDEKDESEEKQKKPKNKWFGNLQFKKSEDDGKSSAAESDLEEKDPPSKKSADAVDEPEKEAKPKRGWFASLNMKKGEDGEKAKSDEEGDKNEKDPEGMQKRLKKKWFGGRKYEVTTSDDSSDSDSDDGDKAKKSKTNWFGSLTLKKSEKGEKPNETDSSSSDSDSDKGDKDKKRSSLNFKKMFRSLSKPHENTEVEAVEAEPEKNGELDESQKPEHGLNLKKLFGMGGPQEIKVERETEVGAADTDAKKKKTGDQEEQRKQSGPGLIKFFGPHRAYKSEEKPTEEIENQKQENGDDTIPEPEEKEENRKKQVGLILSKWFNKGDAKRRSSTKATHLDEVDDLSKEMQQRKSRNSDEKTSPEDAKVTEFTGPVPEEILELSQNKTPERISEGPEEEEEERNKEKSPKGTEEVANSEPDTELGLPIPPQQGGWGPKPRKSSSKSSTDNFQSAESVASNASTNDSSNIDSKSKDDAVRRSWRVLDEDQNIQVIDENAKIDRKSSKKGKKSRPVSFADQIETVYGGPSDTESADHGSADKSSVSKLTSEKQSKKPRLSFLDFMKKSRDKVADNEGSRGVSLESNKDPEQLPLDGAKTEGIVYAELDMARAGGNVMRRDDDKTEYAEIIHPNKSAEFKKSKEELRKSRENLSGSRELLTEPDEKSKTPEGKKEAAV